MWRNANSLSTQSVRRYVPARYDVSKAGIVSPIHREPKNYDIIVENNLFRPLGWKRDVDPPVEQNLTPKPEPDVEPASPLPTYGLALTGIVKEGTHFFAVVEDQKMKMGMFLRRGDMLKDTTVQAITPNYVTLIRGEVAAQLALGESIEYGTDERVRFGSIAKRQALDTPSEADDDEQDLIERLRSRRRTELNQ